MFPVLFRDGQLFVVKFIDIYKRDAPGAQRGKYAFEIMSAEFPLLAIDFMPNRFQ